MYILALSSVLMVELMKLVMCVAGDVRSVSCLCIYICVNMCVFVLSFEQ